MDFQNRAGNKAGGGGNLSYSERNVDRRERMRLLALEISDITKDPYIIRNNIGSYECKLCYTVHNNEGDYLAHTQGKKHQTNIEKRKLKSKEEILPEQPKIKPYLTSEKIGKPGYRITKFINQEEKEISLLFEIDYPEIVNNITPKHKILLSSEQQVERVDNNYKFVVVAAEPYENIAFKVPNKTIEYKEGKFYEFFDEEKKYKLFLTFKPY